jgi:hypothetical protein
MEYAIIIIGGKNTFPHPSHITVMVCIARANREAIQKVTRHEICDVGNHRAQGAEPAACPREKQKTKTVETLTRLERSSLLIIKTEQHHQTDKGANTAAPRTITRRSGNTTYKVNVHFSKTSRETMNDKIMRLIKNEASAKAAGE